MPIASMSGSPKKKRKSSSALAAAQLFGEAERSLLTEEDVGWSDRERGTTELWLVQLPRELDPALLNGQEIDLNGSQQINIEDTAGERLYSIHAVPLEGKSSNTSTVLLPSSNAGRLTAGPPLKGQMSVMRSVSVPPVELPPPEEKRVEMPQGLKKRWKPFGWRDPPSVSERHLKKTIHKHKKSKKTKKSSHKN